MVTMETATEVVHRPKWREQGYMPQRYVVALLAFMGISLNYMLRININLAILVMTKSGVTTESHSSNSSEHFEQCHYKNDNETLAVRHDGEFEWDELSKSLILGAFYWGYSCTQIPGGRLAEVTSAKRVLGFTMVAAALLTMVIPTAARMGYSWLIVARMFLGLSMGSTYPSTHVLLSYWAPPQERSTLSALVYTGAQAGTVLTYPITAVIIDSFGWPAVFYFQGAITLICALLWFCILSDSPDECRFVSEVEKHYINQSLGESKHKKSLRVPWFKALTSLPVLSILVVGIGCNWGFYTLLTDLPIYMKTVLKLDIKTNAMLSATPYIGMFVFSIIISNLGDFVLRRKWASITSIRKTANGIASIGPAICLLCVTLVECDRTSTIVVVFLAVTLQGAIYTGYVINHLDIAPNYAGTLYGISNVFGTSTGWLAPITVGALTNNNESLSQWRKVFYIAAVIHVFTGAFYIAFGTGREQPWNRVHDGRQSDDGKASEKDSKNTILCTNTA